ncbi:hypothetical protein SynMITS9220_00631 [Synechococcus sp. MIT S9220]|nr:hypothetical protein SynMITS9220_00631 [Synechococcus sp. MIT S9220]
MSRVMQEIAGTHRSENLAALSSLGEQVVLEVGRQPVSTNA